MPNTDALECNPAALAPACAQLMLAVAAGDERALRGLYEQMSSQLYGIARRILGSHHDSQEIVLDVFVFLWRNPTRYEAARGTVAAWLSVITRRRAIDSLRKRRDTLSLDDAGPIRTSVPLAPPSHAPDVIMGVGQESSAIRAALSTLSPLRRRLIQMAFYDNYTHSQICHLTRLPLGSVKSHVRRALHTMRATMAQRRVD